LNNLFDPVSIRDIVPCLIVFVKFLLLHISELESGKKKPTAELVLNAARLFCVSTDQLLKDELDLDRED